MKEREDHTIHTADARGLKTRLVDLSRGDLSDRTFTTLMDDMRKAGYLSLNGHVPGVSWIRVPQQSVLTHDFKPNHEIDDHLEWLDFRIPDKSGLVAERGEVLGLDMGEQSFAIVSPHVDLIDVTTSAPGAIVVHHATTPIIASGEVMTVSYGQDDLDDKKNPETSPYLKQIGKIRETLKEARLKVKNGNPAEKNSNLTLQDDRELLLFYIKQDEHFRKALEEAA